MQQGAPQMMPGGVALDPAGLPGYGGQFPYAQPLPMSQTMPMAQPPMPTLYGQPQPQMPAMYGQPQPAMMAAPQSMQAPGQSAAPVAPVASPASPYAQPSGQGPAGQQQNPYTRHLVAIARSLEQAIPNYQIVISVLEGLVNAPQSPLREGKEAIDTLRELTYQHYAALGAIRRLLWGESTPDVAALLASGAHMLNALHNSLRPQLERVAATLPNELRGLLVNLAQTFLATDSFLNQAASGIQALVGPQIWEAARAKLAGQN